MKTGRLIVGLTCIAAVHAPAQQADKVEQYRGMLLKRPENAVLFGRLVDAWLEKGEMAGLKELLESKAKEGGPADWRLLAVFRNFSGDEAGAVAALDEALKKNPDDAPTRLARAKALGAATRFDEALADLAAAMKDPAVAMEAGTLRGKFLARAGRPVEAVKSWKEVIAAHPGDDGLQEDLIELEIGEGMLEEAVAAAKELAGKTADPYQKALRRMRVAEILAQAGKKNEAVAEYRDVFAVSAESSWLEREVLARVNALFSREDDSGGLRAFYEQLRDAYPRRVVVKKEAARSLLASGDGDEAVAMFREVLKVMPGDREVRDEFIALLEGAGRNKDAADEVTALLATADKDAALWEKLAGIRKAMGDAPGTKEAVDKAIALAPEGEAGKISAAALCERFERKDDAERILRDAVKTHGMAGEAGDALAVLLASRGKPDEAVALWREMAKTADREGLLRIVRSLTANGRAADAYGILSSRAGDFEGDPLLLAALCQAAQFSEKSDDAIPQAIELVRQAKTAGDLENALRQALGIVFRSKEPRKWVDELAVKPNPSTQESCLLAEMLESLGDSIEADRVLKKAMEGGDPLMASAQRVRLFEMRGDLPSAITATKDWLALPGGLKTEQVKRLVGLYEKSGDNEAALKETENWKRIAPGDKLAWTKRAELLQADGKSEESVAELRRALAKFGNDEEMRAGLAKALSEAGMFDEAWRMCYGLYDEAESPASKLKWAGSLAEMAASEGREEDLIADFKRRARDNPSSVVPLLALGEMYRAWQRPDEESSTVAEASRRKPEDVALLQRLADLEEQNGSKEKAEALLKSAVRVQNSPENRRRLSAFWIRSGETERGLAELLAVQAGGNPRDTERMVMPLTDAKDWETALRILAGEVPRHPEDWRLAYLHGYVLLEAGKKDEAFNCFAALLEAKGDLTGVTPLIPPDQMKWMAANGRTASDFQYFARFQNLTSRSKDRRQMYYGMAQTGVPMPGTPLELRWMALCQALAIAQETPESRDAKLASLKSGDIPGLDFLKSVHALKPEELRERMLADNADPRLFRWYLDTANYNGNPYQNRGPEFDLLRKGVDLCAKADPELSLILMSRLPLDGENGLGAEGVRKMFDLLSGLDAAKRANFLGTLQTLAFAEEKQVPKDLRDKAEALLLADFKAMKEKSEDNWMTFTMPIQWMRMGRFDEAVTWLNGIYEASKDPARKAKAGGNNPYARYGMYGSRGWSGRGSGEPLKFPEVLAPYVIYPLQSEFNENGGNARLNPSQKKLLDLLGEKPGYNQSPEETKKPIDPAGLAAAIPKLADPYLRVFLAHHVGKPETLAGEITGLEKNHADDPVALLIAAAYRLTVKQDSAGAYKMLATASQIARDDSQRDAMDWSLYQIGLTLAAKPPEGLDLDPARRAALRLRKKMAFDEDSKQQLAQGMVKLGLEEESRRYTAAPMRFSGASRGFSPGMRSGRSGRGAALQSLTALVGEGKREQAARKLLTDIRRLQASTQSGGYSNYELRQLQEMMVSLKLEEEMLKVAQPPEGAGYRSRREYALLLVQMKKMEQALPILRKLVTEKPDDFEINTSLLLALPKEEQKSYVMTLPDGKFDADRIGSWFKTVLDDNGDPKFEDYLDNVGMFVMFLEKIPPSFEAERNLSWVNYIAKDLFDDESYGELRLRPLHPRSGSSGKVDEERTKSRDAMALRLYQAMLCHPQTCEQGFILMQSVAPQLKIPDENLRSSALAAVSLSFRLKQDPMDRMRYGGGSSQYLWMWRTQGGGSTSGSEPEGGQDPMSYLMHQASDGQTVNPFTAEYLADLEKAEPEKAKAFRDCMAIVDAPGTDTFTKWRKDAKQKPESISAQLLSITRLAFFRKRADILDAALDFACDTALGDRQNQYGGFSGVSEVLSLCVSGSDGFAARTAMIERVAKRLLGPPEAWELYGDSERNSSAYAIQVRQSMFQQFCQSFQRDAAGSVALARFIAEHKLGSVAEMDVMQPLRYRSNSADGEKTAKSWLETGLFSPGPSLVGSSRSNGESILESLEQAAGNLGGEGRKKTGVALLKTEGPDRFWARLLGARLAEQPSAAATELDTANATIAKWPADARNDLSRVILKWFPELEKSATGETKRMLADSRKHGDVESRKQAEAYLKDGFPEDMRPYSIDNKLGGMMRRLINDDPALAAKLWSKALEHFQKNLNGWNSSNNGFNQSAALYANSQLMDALDDGEIAIPGLAEFIQLMDKSSAGASGGFFESNSPYYLYRIFDAYRKRTKQAAIADKSLAGLKPEARPFVATMKTLGGETAKEARAILAAMILVESNYNSSEINNNNRQQILDWARKEAARIDPALCHAALLLGIATSDKSATDALKKESRDALLGIVSNKGIPVGLRVSVVSRVASRVTSNGWQDDPACVGALAELLLTNLSAGLGWSSSEFSELMARVAKIKALKPEDAGKMLAAMNANMPVFSNGSSNEARSMIDRIRLSLALRVGDSAEILKIAKSSADDHRGNLDLLIQLWQGGQSEAAVLLAARPGEYHRDIRAWLYPGQSGSGKAPSFTREIESAMPGWLAAVQDPGQRYRIECVLSCAPDAKDALAPAHDRRQRIADLVKRFPAEAPKARVSRNEILAALGAEAAPAIALVDEYTQAVGKQSLGMLIPLRDGNSDNARETEASYVTETLIRRKIRYAIEQRCDTSVLLEQLQSIQFASIGNQEYYASEMVRNITPGFLCLFLRNLSLVPMADRPKTSDRALAVAAALLEKKQDEIVRHAVAFAIASQALSGDGAALDKWLETLPKPAAEKYRKVRSNDGLRASMGLFKDAFLAGDKFAKERRDILTAILTEPVTVKREIKHMTDLSSIMDSGGFSRDDIFAVVDALPENHPRRAEFLCEKAGIIGWRGGKPEDALKAYDAAEAAAAGDEKTLDFVKSYRVMFLDNRNRLAEALVVARTIHLDNLPERERKTVDGVLKKPEPKPKKE